jgi:hypothetical protein
MRRTAKKTDASKAQEQTATAPRRRSNTEDSSVVVGVGKLAMG